jgi:hypothetical protein
MFESLPEHPDDANANHGEACEHSDHEQQPKSDRVSVTGAKDDVQLKRDIPNRSDENSQFQKARKRPGPICGIAHVVATNFQVST